MNNLKQTVVRPRPTARHHAHDARTGKASTQALLDLRAQHSKDSKARQGKARPPVCSWERSNGLAALGTATITLAGASASRVARLPFYCQPAAASHKLNNPPAARRANSQAPCCICSLRLGVSVMGDGDTLIAEQTLQPRFIALATYHPCALSCEPDTSPRLHTPRLHTDSSLSCPSRRPMDDDG